MRAPRAVRTVVALGAALFGTAVPVHAQVCPALPGNAFAFLAVDSNPASKCPASPFVHWVNPSVVFECDFFLNANGFSCGGTLATCANLCRSAASTWNGDLAGHFQLVDASAATPVNLCDPEDGRTSVNAASQDCSGAAFGQNVLAVALRVNFVSGPRTGELVDSDISVNTAFAFSQARFQATLGHEFGHVIGLDHPNQCSRDFNVLMRSASMFSSTDPCFVRDPTSDDVSGALMVYPGGTVVCGDANSDGVVNDVDAVQVLRSAVSLPSSCTLAACDVNSDGIVNDVDGVNVLRAAASLPFANACGL
jgi:hypothetical protein